MILVFVKDSVGESLSAYCFGRVLAARFGYHFEFPQLRGLVRDWGVKGERFIGSAVVWEGHWPMESRSGRVISKKEQWTKPDSRLCLAGGHHRFELLAEERERVRGEWLVPVQGEVKQVRGAFAICLPTAAVLRQDEKPPVGGSLCEEEIRRLVGTVKHSELVLITDRADHPLLEALGDLSWRLEICRGWQQMLLVRSFEKVAISQDATQWWGAFLGDAREIYYPKLETGHWSHPEPAHLAHEPLWHGIDLRVLGDGRYVYDW